MLFNRAQWNVPKTVIVSAIDDGIAEGAHFGHISHTVASADLSYQGISTAAVTVAITDKQIRYSDWVSQHHLAGGSADHHASPSGDGIKNLLKFAFNMDPELPDRHILPVGNGTSGLPRVDFVGGRLRVEYLRRRNAPNMTYSVEFSNAVESGWSASLSPQAVTTIDEIWERVTVLDEAVAISGSRFSRVRISISP